MALTTEILLFALGIILLWFGAEFVIEATKKLARKFHIPEMAIALTVISVGTSLPEIFTNITSGLKVRQGIDASGIAIGTNIGSDITQITLILGLTALLGTMYATKKTIYRDGGMVLFSIIAFFYVGIDGRISQLEGVVFVAIYLIYLYFISRDAHVNFESIRNGVADNNHNKDVKILVQFFFMAVGIALLIYGAEFVVNNALAIADTFGLAQSFLGVLIIGVGTALPEFSTAIRGILKKSEDISLGTLIGSNVTDPLFSTGLGAMVAGFSFPKDLLFFDIPFWFIASLIALLLIHKKMRIGNEDKKEGIILIMLFVIFVILKVRFFM